MRLRISAVALGLLVSVSGGTATPSDDASRPTRTSTGYQRQYDQSDPTWYEPPAWNAAHDNGHDGAIRRLEDTCRLKPSPYNSTTIMDKIGTGSPGLGPPGGLDNCVSAPEDRMLKQGNGGGNGVGGGNDKDAACPEKCLFQECIGGGNTATASAPNKNGSGNHTYSFAVLSSPSSAVSHGE